MGTETEVVRVDSHFTRPQLIVTFEQSRSVKGVAVTQTELGAEDNSFFEQAEPFLLRETLRQLRAGTVEAHGVDLMPPQDDWYWLDPWPPKQTQSGFYWIYRTTLKYGDGVSNLREHALQTLKHARARGVKIKVPVR